MAMSINLICINGKAQRWRTLTTSWYSSGSLNSRASRAARSLGMPISTVSRRLSVLESELGVSLLRRTTRRVTLTAQGREYFNQCQEPLNLLQEAEQVLTQAQKKPEGMLRISVPVILGQEVFLEFIS